MGRTSEIKVAILCGVFLVTCFFVYSSNKSEVIVNKPSLMQHFQNINGYITIRNIPLDDSAYAMLELDDYVFADYQGKNSRINLYIGYYYRADTASASHSPLICYQSHGWKVEGMQSKHTLTAGKYTIHYNEIITSLDEEKELVLFWYQSHDDTNTHPTRNKFDLAINSLLKNDEQHAFVRIAIPMTGTTYEQAKKTAIDFIQAFYPQFIRFIGV